MTLKEAIRVLAMSGAELYCKICTVDAVDVEARTVDWTPIDESAPLVGVNLQASQDGSVGVVQFPAAGITLNGGRLGGLVISGKTAGRLNALENDINELKAVFSAWVPAGTDGGAALKTAAAAWANRQLTQTVAAELENDSVKH